MSDQEKNTTKKTRTDETIKRQILTNVKKYLAELANQNAESTGDYIAPTTDEIKAECKKRWAQRIERSKPKEDVSAYFA